MDQKGGQRMRRKARDRDGLYKRKDSPYWWISFTVDGKQYQRSTRTTDEKIAMRILAKVQTQVMFGKQEKPQYTFRELTEKYVEW